MAAQPHFSSQRLAMSGRFANANLDSVPHAYDFQTVQHDIVECVKGVISSELDGKSYAVGRARSLVSTINKRTVDSLSSMSRNFKYIASTLLMQKDDGSLHTGMQTASSHVWDGRTDGTVSVSWENRTIQCAVTIHVFAI